MKYFWSLLAIIVGFLLVKYSHNIVNSFGYVDSAEKWLGTYGGTKLMWKLIGLLLIIGALLVISGLMNNVLFTIFSPMMGGVLTS